VVGILLGPFFTPLLVGTWRSAWWQMLLAVLGITLFAYFAPGKIAVNEHGIAEKRLLKVRNIPWDKVMSAVEEERTHKIIITSLDGTEIVHTDMHISPSEFVQELKKFNVKAIEQT
jgi:hypothetical protein